MLAIIKFKIGIGILYYCGGGNAGCFEMSHDHVNFSLPFVFQAPSTMLDTQKYLLNKYLLTK